ARAGRDHFDDGARRRAECTLARQMTRRTVRRRELDHGRCSGFAPEQPEGRRRHPLHAQSAGRVRSVQQAPNAYGAAAAAAAPGRAAPGGGGSGFTFSPVVPPQKPIPFFLPGVFIFLETPAGERLTPSFFRPPPPPPLPPPKEQRGGAGGGRPPPKGGGGGG